MRILGIETSCDETGIGIYDSKSGLVAHTLYSQIDTHAEYGGTVPEIASREHVSKILPLIDSALKKAELTNNDIDGIAYTKGPGLAGALLVGASVAKTIGMAWNKPTLGVHHLEGHLLAPLLDVAEIEFPFLALLVSGGHTMLINVKSIGNYELLGESIDDAAGEAFDKTARLLNLGFPGGPRIEQAAKQGYPEYSFPRPMCEKPGLNFSFSGLKTFTRNTFEQSDKSKKSVNNIAASFQEAVIDVLYKKCKRAINKTKAKRLVISGGVSANVSLRLKLTELERKQGVQVYYPRLDFCTDNGAMIALVGSIRMEKGQIDTSNAIDVKPRWPLVELKD